MKAIDQQLFDALYLLADGEGFDVYDYLPLDDVPYPFVVIGEIQVLPRQVKHKTLGRLVVMVDIWAHRDNRSEISEISERLMEIFSSWIILESRRVKLHISASNKRVLSDTTTDLPLWHGILELEFRIY